MKRTQCVICDSNKLESFLEYNMPVYSGPISHNNDYAFNPMIFGECKDCKSVQLLDIINPNTVYMIDHNTEIVGELWSNHYREFSKFIGNTKDKTILELSDPSAKIAKLCNGYKKWFIVEPNSCIDSDENDKIQFIKKFFDKDFVFDEKIDLVVHSHFFEHMYDPKRILDMIYELLDSDGLMYFSVPDLNYLLEMGYQPNNILHFEHTFFFDLKRLTYLLSKTGFEILEIQNFKNHSVFFKCIKTTKRLDNPEFSNVKEKIKGAFEQYKLLIEKIKKEAVKYDNIILFGCHMSSQFLLSNGLDENDIDFIADNSKNKQGKYLYGFNLKTISPNDIPDKSLVILSHSGIYSKEIKESLEKLDKKLIFV